MKTKALSREVAILIGLDGVTVYMTRKAMQSLVTDLHRVLSADPEECFETHLGLHFSAYTDDGIFRQPPVTDGLADILEAKRRESFEAAIMSGEIDADATMSPFEVTLMHVSAAAVAEEGARPDD